MIKVKLYYSVCIIVAISIFLSGDVLSSPTKVMQAKWSSSWRPYGGYVDEIEFVVFTETEIPLAMLALQNGDVDGYDERLNYLLEYLPVLVKNPYIEITFTPSRLFRSLTLNCEKFPTNITAFRRAMAFGFDKYRANVECIGGIGHPQDSYIPQTLAEWEVESVLPEHFYDADFVSGNASLEKAGFKDLDGDGWREYDKNNNGVWDPGIDLEDNAYADGGIMELHATAAYDPAVKICVIMQEGLEKMGIRTQTIEMEFFQIFQLLWPGDIWATCWTEGVSFVNPIKILHNNWATGGINNIDPYNYYHYNNATINAVLDEMVSTTDLNVAKEKAREANLMLTFEQPQIVAYNDVNIGAYRNDRFDGWFEFSGVGFSQCDNWACVSKVHLKESLGGPYGGTFYYCLSDNLNTLNPYLTYTIYDRIVYQYIYEKLWNIDPFTWDPIPGLAYDWNIEETTASGEIQDGLKYTFYLYENETWHDGEVFNAADVNHSIYMWRNSSEGNPEMWDIYKIAMPDGPLGYTIELYVNKTGFFEFGDTTNFYITPEHIWRGVIDVNSFNPTVAQTIGTGPYVMRTHVPGEYIRLERHEDWRWDIRDASAKTTTTSEEPSQITVTITVPASCPECPSPETVVLTDRVTKTIVKTVYPEDTSKTTETSEETGEMPGVTPGFEINSVFTLSVVLGVPLIYQKRRKR
ncbi:MAG: ABC transporter substrate-binding protein [Promethearchaeota archaeon]